MKMLKKLPDEMAEEKALVLSAFSLRCKYYHLLFLEYLYRNIAICCLWQPSFGLKIPTEYPLAILFASSQMIAFCTFVLKLPMSENLLLPLTDGCPAYLQSMIENCSGDTGDGSLSPCLPFWFCSNSGRINKTQPSVRVKD